MKLSFLPADLHLIESGGDFILSLSDREILNTKSERVALAKFHSIKAEMETRFPMREPTADEKAQLLQHEIAVSIVVTVPVQARSPRLSASAMDEVKKAVNLYYTDVETSDLSLSSQATYIDMVNIFVRWLNGDFTPGSRKEAYRVRKRKD